MSILFKLDLKHAILFGIFVDIDCPAGMVYQQCGQACPQTCNIESAECAGGCVEGCFCPVGNVLWNGNCIDASECAGIHTINNKVSNTYHV